MNATLKRLMQAPASMTCPQAAEVLNVSEHTVKRLVKKGRIGSQRYHANEQGQRPRMSTDITRAAVMRYLIRICCGDERDELMHDIEQHAPAWLDMAKRTVARLQQEAEADVTSATPGKIIPIFGQKPSRRTGGKQDHFAAHPDLFGGVA